VEAKSRLVKFFLIQKLHTMNYKRYILAFIIPYYFVFLQAREMHQESQLYSGLPEDVEISNNLSIRDPELDSLLRLYHLAKPMVNISFGTREKSLTTGAITVLNPREFLQFDNNNTVEDALRGRIPGITSGFNLYGLGQALVVVDGIPRVASSVNIEEVEQITVLKDVSAAILYGTQAKNGVILITTRRGVPHQPQSDVSFERGFASPVSLPMYLNASRYMELFNEALINDGLPLRYTDQEIKNTLDGVDPIRYPDVDYFSSEFLRKTLPVNRFMTELSGGNDLTQYYLNTGWLRSGTLLDMGEGRNENYDRLNLRANVDFRINEVIKSNINIVALFDIMSGASGNFWRDATQLLPNYYPPLIDTALVNDKDMLEAARIIDGKYILGGTSQYRNNIYGNLNVGGYSNLKNTTAQFSNGIDVDLKTLLKGLTLKTYISFDFYNRYIASQDNEYAVYQPVWSTDTEGQEILNFLKIGTDRFTGTQGISNSSNIRRTGFYGMLNYYKKLDDRQTITARLVSYADKYSQTGVLHDDPGVHLGSGINYVLDEKYIIDFNSALVNSTKLPPGNRLGFSPSFALGWIISEENFLNKNRIINYLKIKASAGILNSDQNISNHYLYQSSYVQGPHVSWADGAKFSHATRYSTIDNDNLFYEKRKNFGLGLEAALLNNSIWVDANYFHDKITDQIVRRNSTYPLFYGGFLPFENYDADKYSGIDLGLRWSKSYSEFTYEIGLSLVYLKTEVLQKDEIYQYEYQYRTGKPVSAIFGLEAIGLFEDQDDINEHAIQYFGEVQPGDIKYKDQNNDGVIDQNDEIMIGNSLPNLSGGMNFTLKYKNLALFVLATGVNGSSQYYNNSYYWVYGERKYSVEVLDRWTPETALTATYPRLSSGGNSNNFRGSDFWLYNNSGITINRVQLTYDIPGLASGFTIKQFGLYLRADNVACIAKNRDRIELNVGSQPQYRSYLIGLKALF
jgi:TonB-linked SusC/RagA family outer membrane protein